MKNNAIKSKEVTMKTTSTMNFEKSESKNNFKNEGYTI